MTETENRRTEKAPDFETDAEVIALLGLAKQVRALRDELYANVRAFNTFIFSAELSPASREQEDTKWELSNAVAKSQEAWSTVYIAFLQQWNGIARRDIPSWRPKLDRLWKEEVGHSDFIGDMTHNASMTLYASFERERARERGKEERRKADPKEQARMKALLANYERVKEVRAKALADSEAELALLQETIEKLPPPATPGQPPTKEELTPEQLSAQDQVIRSLERLHHLFFVWAYGVDRTFASDRDMEAGGRAYELASGGMPKQWMAQEMRRMGENTAEELDTMGTSLMREASEEAELVRDGYLTQETRDANRNIDEKQRERLSELSTQAHELHREHILRIIRKRDEEEGYRLLHEDEEKKDI